MRVSLTSAPLGRGPLQPPFGRVFFNARLQRRGIGVTAIANFIYYSPPWLSTSSSTSSASSSALPRGKNGQRRPRRFLSRDTRDIYHACDILIKYDDTHGSGTRPRNVPTNTLLNARSRDRFPGNLSRKNVYTHRVATVLTNACQRGSHVGETCANQRPIFSASVTAPSSRRSRLLGTWTVCRTEAVDKTRTRPTVVFVRFFVNFCRKYNRCTPKRNVKTDSVPTPPRTLSSLVPYRSESFHSNDFLITSTEPCRHDYNCIRFEV